MYERHEGSVGTGVLALLGNAHLTQSVLNMLDSINKYSSVVAKKV